MDRFEERRLDSPPALQEYERGPGDIRPSFWKPGGYTGQGGRRWGSHVLEAHYTPTHREEVKRMLRPEVPKEYDLVVVIEIAELLGVSHWTVRQWRKREHLEFPPPDIKAPGLRTTPMWYWKTVREWALIYRPKNL